MTTKLTTKLLNQKTAPKVFGQGQAYDFLKKAASTIPVWDQWILQIPTLRHSQMSQLQKEQRFSWRARNVLMLWKQKK